MTAKKEKNDEKTPLIPLLLLEIGTEEIPARFLIDGLSRLKDNFEKLVGEYRLPCHSVKTFATPRRLSLLAEVEPMQQAAEKEVWGPPVNVAFDKDGNPTRAAEAFAKTNGLSLSNLERKEKGKGTYLVAIIKEEARKTEEILEELTPKLILSLTFPKSMRWGNSNLRFVRPIHWILATYGNKRIPFEIEGIKSITMSRGHRFLAPASFDIRDNSSYLNLLRNNYVIADPDERKKIIIEGARKLASSVNATLVEDEELLQHVTYLVEFPTPVLGTFPEEYLALPKELLITVMKGHQKYFALQDNNEKLTNFFIIISNTKQDNQKTIKKGAEKVIRPRFEDARFYYESDVKVKLKARLDELKKVIYHEKLGTLYDKSQRIAAISDFIAGKCCSEKKKDIHTASLLSKADLLSGVVREFPELQGIMGMYYAKNEAYPDEVAVALSEQYLPSFSGDRLPSTEIGAVVSLADKLDNITSFFMLGQSPSGSEDPFALRRQAIGVISILVDRKYELTIAQLFEKALLHFKTRNKGAVVQELVKFFEQRLEPLFLSLGYPLDAIASVEHFTRSAPLYTLKERLEALRQFKTDMEYEPFLVAIKRANNIAPKEEMPAADPKLFVQEEEGLLYREVEYVTPLIQSMTKENKFFEAIKVLLTLKDPIHRFFDKVLIMDKDEQTKQNRLSLIKQIQELGRLIADFSKLS